MRLLGEALLVANATRGDAGLYSLSCSNSEGSGSAAVRLIVHCEPTVAPGGREGNCNRGGGNIGRR